ncbi:hypothetical protein ACP4OV_011837 [Aristida adscensionis]
MHITFHSISLWLFCGHRCVDHQFNPHNGYIMGNTVTSALAQAGVSSASSYLSSKIEEKTSRAHLAAKLEMSLSRLEFALEVSRKLPITYVSLLRRAQMLRSAYMEGTNLLNKHKVERPEDKQRVMQDQSFGQAVITSYPPFLEWICRAKNVPVSSLVAALNKEYLSSSAVRIFEWYAACADRFVRDVEFGNPLRHDTFRYPLVRPLLEGRTLMYEMVKGSKKCQLFLWPQRLEGRGVEAYLRYIYYDKESAEKSIHLFMILRLSEDTDLIGIAIKSLRYYASQLNFVTESAMEELATLYQWREISAMYPEIADRIQEIFPNGSESYRPDPICCTSSAVSSHSLLGVPESVILIDFTCCISRPEYILHNSTLTHELGKNIPLLLGVFFTPHMRWSFKEQVAVCYGDKREHIGSGDMELVEEMLRLKAIDCVEHKPEPLEYRLSWQSPHGGAHIYLCKLGNKLPWWFVPEESPRGGARVAKRKRRRL